jgi:hypothetical protein
LQTIPPQLKPYYKNKANQYLMNQNPWSHAAKKNEFVH